MRTPSLGICGCGGIWAAVLCATPPSSPPRLARARPREPGWRRKLGALGLGWLTGPSLAPCPALRGLRTSDRASCGSSRPRVGSLRQLVARASPSNPSWWQLQQTPYPAFSLISRFLVARPAWQNTGLAPRRSGRLSAAGSVLVGTCPQALAPCERRTAGPGLLSWVAVSDANQCVGGAHSTAAASRSRVTTVTSPEPRASRSLLPAARSARLLSRRCPSCHLPRRTLAPAHALQVWPAVYHAQHKLERGGPRRLRQFLRRARSRSIPGVPTDKRGCGLSGG